MNHDVGLKYQETIERQATTTSKLMEDPAQEALEKEWYGEDQEWYGEDQISSESEPDDPQEDDFDDSDEKIPLGRLVSASLASLTKIMKEET